MRGPGELMEGLDKIVEKVDFLNSDEASRERLIKEYWDYQELQGIRREGKEEGLEEGREEGRAERSREIAKAMKENGASPEFIARCTDLSAEEIAAL